jgi:hypothetical protein
MVRIQLHLTERQDRLLRARARRCGATRADLIRRGIDRLLDEPDGTADPLLELIGAAGKAGRSDSSERHDEIIYELPPRAVAGSRAADGARVTAGRRRGR